MSWMFRLVALAVLAAPAHAALIQYNFEGKVVVGPVSWQEKAIGGYFRFNAATAPTSPGVWYLPTATFHVVYPGLTLDTAGGVTATVSESGEAITFEAIVEPYELPVPNCCGGVLDMFFETYTDGYFSNSTLPTTVPPGDKYLSLKSDAFGVGTDTAFGVSIPEPATAAFVLAGLIGLAWGVRYKTRA